MRIKRAVSVILADSDCPGFPRDVCSREKRGNRRSHTGYFLGNKWNMRNVTTTRTITRGEVLRAKPLQRGSSRMMNVGYDDRSIGVPYVKISVVPLLHCTGCQ